MLTFDEQMAMGDSSAKYVLCFAHVFTLVLREDLHNSHGALTLGNIDLDLEVLVGLNRLAVEKPSDVRGGETSVQDPHDTLVTIIDCLVAEGQCEARRFLYWVQRNDCTWFTQRNWSTVWLVHRSLGRSML